MQTPKRNNHPKHNNLLAKLTRKIAILESEAKAQRDINVKTLVVFQQMAKALDRHESRLQPDPALSPLCKKGAAQ